ncbi:MAG TPA: dihydrolipoamide acetyltransferase family protein [Streptosporangiaceae bacterium]|nr:dihydrolipoamide acetyltransferase family protein [Streptosporangiaceae bacterium]
MPDFLLPDLGEGLEEAEVIAWRVQVGDQVTVDQVVAEVETAKAAVELPIPFAGQVSALHAEPGATVPVGAPLISVTTAPSVTSGADVTAGPGVTAGPVPALREPGVTTPGPAACDGGEASGNVLIGYGTRPAPRRVRSARRPAPVSALTPAGPLTPVSVLTPAGPAGPAAGPVPVISPVVRKLARDAGLDLTRITGTGPHGLVRRHDVDEALAARRAPAPEAAPVPEAAPALVPAPLPGAEPGETRIPLRGARKLAAAKLARSRREIPEATVWVDADATGLLAARSGLNTRTPDRPVSLLALLARFALAGLRQYPELNARIDGDEVVIPAHVHLGFAAQTGRGLVVPVVKDAHRLSTRELSAALTQRTEDARAGRLAPADLTGGTFTVNNYGVFGVDGSAAIINHPEVAILGLGRIIDRPWVVDGQVVARKVTELTLAFDHRACDGGTAGGFLRYVADCVESPLHALGDL